MNEAVTFEIDGRVALMTINRAERGNAMSADVVNGLVEGWRRVESDKAIRVAVLTAAGERHFCTGADVSNLSTQSESQAANVGTADGWLRACRMMPRSAGVRKPVIVAVNGTVAGAGLHFIGEADIVIASERASFLDTHVSVGQVAGFEPPLLARRIPFEAAMRMALMGKHERVDAQRALALGLVSEVVAPERLRARAMEIAGLIGQNSPAAVARTKEAAWTALERPLEEAMARGWDLITGHYGHPDQTEGPAAFGGRREPEWTD